MNKYLLLCSYLTLTCFPLLLSLLYSVLAVDLLAKRVQIHLLLPLPPRSMQSPIISALLDHLQVSQPHQEQVIEYLRRAPSLLLVSLLHQ